MTTSALREWQIVGAGDPAGDAARIGAVVDKDQPALGGLAQDRSERRLGGGEARSHRVGEADIALEPAHQPVQPVDILLRRERGEQRLRAGIVVRILNGSIGTCSRISWPAVRARSTRGATSAPYGMKPSVTGPGSLAIASAVALALTPRPPTMSAMRGASGLPGSGCTGRANASAGRVAVGGYFRNGAVRGHLDEFLGGRGGLGRRRGARRRWNHHFLLRTGFAVDDCDRRGVAAAHQTPATMPAGVTCPSCCWRAAVAPAAGCGGPGIFRCF